jgi:hypothetical protein
VDDDEQAESLVRALQAHGYRVLALVEQEVSARIATVRLVSPEAMDEGVALDLLFASSGIESEVIATADEMELFEGIRAAIASTASLIALKVLSRDDLTRPQDRMDLVALLAVASAEDVVEATRLLGLIQDRGFGRGRDLGALLDDLRAELA